MWASRKVNLDGQKLSPLRCTGAFGARSLALVEWWVGFPQILCVPSHDVVPQEAGTGAAFKKKIISVGLWAGEWSAGQGGSVPAGAGAGGSAGGEAGIAASGH